MSFILGPLVREEPYLDLKDRVAYDTGILNFILSALTGLNLGATFLEKIQGQVDTGGEGTSPVFYSICFILSLPVQQPSGVTIINLLHLVNIYLDFVIPTLFQFNSVAHSCLTLCDPMNLSMPGLPVHHQLPEFTQTHVH